MADNFPKPLPEDWEDIELGPGQEPTAQRFQASDRGDARRHPDTGLTVIIKPPERPY